MYTLAESLLEPLRQGTHFYAVAKRSNLLPEDLCASSPFAFRRFHRSVYRRSQPSLESVFRLLVWQVATEEKKNKPFSEIFDNL